MKEYTPFLVIGIFGVLLFLGTIIWTEYLFPKQKQPKSTVKQGELEFPKSKPAERHEMAVSGDR